MPLAALFGTPPWRGLRFAATRGGEDEQPTRRPPPSPHQSRNLPTSERAVKALQRMLTTLNHQGVRLGRQKSGRDTPLCPSRTFAPTVPGLSGSGLYTASGCALPSLLERGLRFAPTPISPAAIRTTRVGVSFGGCPGPLSQIETFVTFCGIVWLRAKVLGQMGWTTSPYLRAGALSCPSLAIDGPGSYGAPAFRFAAPPRPDALSPSV